jgi:hypothetical protein
MKNCRVCGKLKKLDDFYSLGRNRDGRDTRCKECVRSAQKEIYQATKNPKKIKERNLKVRYGLSIDEYTSMIKDGCAVCGTLDNLCVDHDHNCCPGKQSCGKCIRGILCWNHNIADGKFQTVEEIEKYLKYRKSFIKA